MTPNDALAGTRLVTSRYRDDDPRSTAARIERLTALEIAQNCSRGLSGTIRKHLPLLLIPGAEKWGTGREKAKVWKETETPPPHSSCEGKGRHPHLLRDWASLCCEKSAGWLLQAIRLFAGLGCIACQRLFRLSARLRKRSAAASETLSAKGQAAAHNQAM